jgi:hypothetical protein
VAKQRSSRSREIQEQARYSPNDAPQWPTSFSQAEVSSTSHNSVTNWRPTLQELYSHFLQGEQETFLPFPPLPSTLSWHTNINSC